MTKIKDLPIEERPREKGLRYGIDKLSNQELLAIIIGSGTKGYSALDAAHHLLNDHRGLHLLSLTPFSQLIKEKGINKATACKLLAAFELAKRFETVSQTDLWVFKEPEAVYMKYRLRMSSMDKEQLWVILLNKKNVFIKEILLFQGQNNTMGISPMEIIKEALKNEAKKFILLHNHPQGKALPSEEDIKTTRYIKNLALQFGLLLLDHIIIAQMEYYSFLEEYDI